MGVLTRLGGIAILACTAACTFQSQPPDVDGFSVSGTVSADSTLAASIVGTIHSGAAPLRTSWRILQRGVQDVSTRFRVEWTPPGSADLSWDLSSCAHALLRDLSAPADTYVLELTLVDGDGVTTRRTAGFRVAQACAGASCDQPFPLRTSFDLGAQAWFFSILSIRMGYPDGASSPMLPTDSLDLAFRFIDGSLLIQSPSAAAAHDTDIARWRTRNRTTIVPAPPDFRQTATVREVMAGLGNDTAQSQRLSEGSTFLLRLSSGAVGWIRIDNLTLRGDSSSLSVTFAHSP